MRGPDGRRHPRTAALLGTQLLFNVGFYAVVPFLAIVLTDSFAVGGAAVGLVLGVRTFTQQGLFLVGGTLADRFGARTIILLGCGVRVAGFLGLAGSLWTPPPQLWLFVLGTVLTGLGGALFSPGLNTLIAAAESRRGRVAGRATLFAWLGITGELGAIVGPLVGSALLGWGFEVVAASGAVFFVGIGGFLWWALPPAAGSDPHPGGARPVRVWALRDRRFVGFAALHAVDLLAYNQLYLTLPLELRRADDGPALIGAMFAWASVLTLVLQLPLATWSARVGPRVALSVGYSAGASGFAVLAVSAAAGPGHSLALPAVAAAVTLLMTGQLLANPTALCLVPTLAGARPTGSYYGLLATGGGTMVLLGNLIAGALFGPDQQPSVWTWTFLAALPVISAVLVPRLIHH